MESPLCVLVNILPGHAPTSLHCPKVIFKKILIIFFLNKQRNKQGGGGQGRHHTATTVAHTVFFFFMQLLRLDLLSLSGHIVWRRLVFLFLVARWTSSEKPVPVREQIYKKRKKRNWKEKASAFSPSHGTSQSRLLFSEGRREGGKEKVWKSFYTNSH